MRRGDPTPLSIKHLANYLNTQLSPESFFISPGYYAPLADWAEAQLCCGEAYQASSVVERYKRLHTVKVNGPIGAYTLRQLAALQHVWLALGQPSTLRVLDFGGALGSHFYALATHWPWCRLSWTVCETTAVANAGNTEFNYDRLDGSTLRFSDQAEVVLESGCDLVFASCSLQYIEHWPKVLKQFAAVPWLLIDRVPLIDHHCDLIAIQVVPASYTDTRYPGWKFAHATWPSRLEEAGFEQVMHWLVPEDRWSILDLETGRMRWTAQHDHGFLLRRREILTTSQPTVTF
jgi:putative methyltransferase (TIGR04325 family)